MAKTKQKMTSQKRELRQYIFPAAILITAFICIIALGLLLKPQDSTSEHEKIDRWIQVNHLNQYGDPTDTSYLGGTPLYNEVAGRKIDLYDYILQRHPDKPWDR